MPPIRARSVRTLQPAHLRVEVTLERVVQGDNLDEVTPAQLLRQRRNKLAVRELLGELHHPP
jgi:hypothetical protein